MAAGVKAEYDAWPGGEIVRLKVPMLLKTIQRWLYNLLSSVYFKMFPYAWVLGRMRRNWTRSSQNSTCDDVHITITPPISSCSRPSSPVVGLIQSRPTLYSQVVSDTATGIVTRDGIYISSPSRAHHQDPELSGLAKYSALYRGQCELLFDVTATETKLNHCYRSAVCLTA